LYGAALTRVATNYYQRWWRGLRAEVAAAWSVMILLPGDEPGLIEIIDHTDRGAERHQET